MVIKRVSKTVFDVFFGLGWENWCRFETTKEKGRVILHKIGGRSVPEDIMLAIRKKFVWSKK